MVSVKEKPLSNSRGRLLSGQTFTIIVHLHIKICLEPQVGANVDGS